MVIVIDFLKVLFFNQQPTQGTVVNVEALQGFWSDIITLIVNEN